VGILNGGESLGHVVVPGQSLLVHQRQSKPRPDGAETEAGGGEPEQASAPIGRGTVEGEELEVQSTTCHGLAAEEATEQVIGDEHGGEATP